MKIVKSFWGKIGQKMAKYFFENQIWELKMCKDINANRAVDVSQRLIIMMVIM